MTAINIASRLAEVKAASPAPKPIPASDLAWEQIDVETMPETIKSAFLTLLKAQEAERVARKAITEELISILDLPPHLTVRVAAKWGKLSVAIDKTKRSTGKAALSLSDLVARANKL